jgi:hypothetical protein
MEFDDEVGGYYDSELQELLKDFETSEELLVEECNIEE